MRKSALIAPLFALLAAACSGVSEPGGAAEGPRNAANFVLEMFTGDGETIKAPAHVRAAEAARLDGVMPIDGFRGTAVEMITARDQVAIARATAYAMHELENGEQAGWQDVATGHRGTVTPVSRTRDAAGRSCRRFFRTFYAEAWAARDDGVACRMRDGSWRVM